MTKIAFSSNSKNIIYVNKPTNAMIVKAIKHNAIFDTQNIPDKLQKEIFQRTQNATKNYISKINKKTILLCYNNITKYHHININTISNLLFLSKYLGD